MQSHSNDTRVSNGYEIGGSVTDGEIFAGTWERDVTIRLNWSWLLSAWVASKLPNAAFVLDLLLGLSSLAYVSDRYIAEFELSFPLFFFMKNEFFTYSVIVTFRD